MFDARRSKFDVVPGVGLLDACMMRDAETNLFCLIHHRLHQIAVDAK